MSNNILLSSEQFELSASGLGSNLHFKSSLRSLDQDMLGRPGRFKLITPLIHKLWAYITSVSYVTNALRILDGYIVTIKNDSISPQWEIFLRYLQEKEVIDLSDGVIFHKFPYDKVNITAVSLRKTLKNNRDGKVVEVKGFGSGLSIDDALSRAAGEVLERYMLSSINPVRVSLSTKILHFFRIPFLDPSLLIQFSEHQSIFRDIRRYRPDMQIEWVLGRHLLSSRRILLPAQVVTNQKGEEFRRCIIRDINSNGGAGHFSRERAILKGIYELIERDGFLIFWLNNIAPPQIDPSSIDNQELQLALQKLTRYRFQCFFLNTTTDIGIPSFTAVLVDRSNTAGPSIAMGGGCGCDPEDAIRSSLYEALTVAGFRSDEIGFKFDNSYKPFRNRFIGKKQRVAIWKDSAMFPAIEPFLKGKVRKFDRALFSIPIFQNSSDEYQYILEKFRTMGSGYEIYCYEVKKRILQEIGFYVVKVVIPQLVHLYLNEYFASTGAQRLRTVPEKLGYNQTKTLNPLPHPFP